MRQIFPSPVEGVVPFEMLTSTISSRSSEETAKPWVMANMVMSADGSYASGGRSGGLSGAADKELFHALRSIVDVVLVGAGTARQEHYRRPTVSPSALEWRRGNGMSDAARLVIVSASGRFPQDQPFRSGEGADPIVYHTNGDIPGVAVEDGIEYRKAPGVSVDLGIIIDELASQGARLILCEGGPTLLGDLCQAHLMDQLFLTVAPKLVAGEHTGILGNTHEIDTGLKLDSILEDAGFLMLSYRAVK